MNLKKLNKTFNMKNPFGLHGLYESNSALLGLMDIAEQFYSNCQAARTKLCFF